MRNSQFENDFAAYVAGIGAISLIHPLLLVAMLSSDGFINRAAFEAGWFTAAVSVVGNAFLFLCMVLWGTAISFVLIGMFTSLPFFAILHLARALHIDCLLFHLVGGSVGGVFFGPILSGSIRSKGDLHLANFLHGAPFFVPIGLCGSLTYWLVSKRLARAQHGSPG
jgi:hypothetical protein